MDNKNECVSCKEPTKYKTGAWHGQDGTSGYIYDCKNGSCPKKQKAAHERIVYERRAEQVASENEKNGISARAVKELRKRKKVTIYALSKKTGISCQRIAAYENGIEPIPTDIHKRIVQAILNPE